MKQVMLKKSQLTNGLAMFLAKFIHDHGVLTEPVIDQVNDTVTIKPVQSIEGCSIKKAIHRLVNPTDSDKQDCYAMIDAFSKKLSSVN
jgi:hypothetical protein